MSAFADLMARHVAPYFPYSPGQLKMLESHYELMMRWNRRINLTAITEIEDVVKRHYGESLALAAAIPAGSAWSIVDAGSGPGFPGVPLAIMRPDCRVTMLEIDVRKGVFIKETTLDVPNAFVRNERLSAYAPGCDWLVSRALHRQELIPYATAHTCSAALLVSDDQIAEIEADWRGGYRWEARALPWKGQGSVLVGVPQPKVAAEGVE